MQSILARAAAASALALVLGVGASAQSISSGYVGAGYAKTEVEDGGDADGFTLDGAYFNSLGGRFNLQANAGFSSFENNAGGEQDTLTGELHLFARNSDSHAFGGFGTVIDSEDDDTTWGIGGEGELYRGSWTFGGVAGWFEDEDVDSLYGVCGYGRLYGSESFLVEGRAGLVNIDVGGGETEAFSFGGGAEYMFAGTGFSVAGSVDRSQVDDIDLEATTLRIGGKYHFGTSGLAERDRQGAGMPGATCLRRAMPF